MGTACAGRSRRTRPRRAPAQHRGHEHQVEVVDPDARVRARVLEDRVGEALVDAHVALPRLGRDAEPVAEVVEKRPQRVVADTAVEVLLLVLGEEDRDEIVLGELLARLRLQRIRARPFRASRSTPRRRAPPERRGQARRPTAAPRTPSPATVNANRQAVARNDESVVSGVLWPGAPPSASRGAEVGTTYVSANDVTHGTRPRDHRKLLVQRAPPRRIGGVVVLATARLELRLRARSSTVSAAAPSSWKESTRPRSGRSTSRTRTSCEPCSAGLAASSSSTTSRPASSSTSASSSPRCSSGSYDRSRASRERACAAGRRTSTGCRRRDRGARRTTSSTPVLRRRSGSRRTFRSRTSRTSARSCSRRTGISSSPGASRSRRASRRPPSASSSARSTTGAAG